MIELLRDPAWQFAGIIIALLAVAVTILIYIMQRQRKRLAFEILSKNQLLTVGEELEGKLKVFYDGELVRDIFLLIVRVSNIGNVAISKTDYEEELSLFTGSTSAILSAVVTDVDPANLDSSLEVNGPYIKIKRILLNPKDSLTIKCLVKDFSGQFSADARIIGVRKVEDSGRRSAYRIFFVIFSIIVSLIGLYLMVKTTPKQDINPPMLIEFKIGLLVTLIGYVGIFLSMITAKGFKRIHLALRKAIRAEILNK